MTPFQKSNLTGGKIRSIRRALRPRVTQNDLAGRLSVQGIPLDRTMITKIENGTRSISDIEIAAIAKALRVSVGFLFGEKAAKWPGC